MDSNKCFWPIRCFLDLCFREPFFRPDSVPWIYWKALAHYIRNTLPNFLQLTDEMEQQKKKKAYRNTTEVALNYGRTLSHSTLSTDRTQLAKPGKRGYWCLFMYNVYHYNEDVTQWQSQQHQYPSCLFLIFFFSKRKTFHFSFASELRIFLYAVLYYSFNFL